MPVRNVLLLAVVCAAVFAAHKSYSSPAAGAVTAGAPATSRGAAGPVMGSAATAGTTGGAEMAESTGARIRALVGRAGAKLAAPAVRSMSAHTRELLADLKPAIERSRGREAVRARQLSTQIMQADSAAMERLADGQPIEAIRYAMFSKGLIPAVRQTVAEETAFR